MFGKDMVGNTWEIEAIWVDSRGRSRDYQYTHLESSMM